MTKLFRTHSVKAKDITRNWHLLDAKDAVLGRLSSQAARLLIGKHKPSFSSHLDCGDYVVIVNARDVKVTGNKLLDKMYHRHSGQPGGLKSQNLQDFLATRPDRVIETAVKGMLPKNKLQTDRLRRLKVFADDQHPYSSKLVVKTAPTDSNN